MHPVLSRHIYAAPAWLKRPGGRLPIFDFDFANDRYFMQGVSRPYERIVITRTTTAWYDRGDGVFVNVASGARRRNQFGLLVEAARTNVLLWNRDLTNAAWVAVNVTAAKDQIGIDGVTNSASSIISTAGNGTILQTVVQGAANCRVSMFVKRITGSGVIQMTEDNGITWTPVTVTSAWTQVSVPAQSIASPVTGIRIVTSGDKVAVDMIQNETITAGTPDVYTSPIDTTTAAVTRNIDSYKMTTANVPGFSATKGTIFAAAFIHKEIPSAGSYTIAGVSDATNNNRIQLRIATAASGFIVVDATVTQANVASVVPVAGAKAATAASWLANDFRCWNGVVLNGGTTGTRDTAGTVPTVTQFDFSGPVAGGNGAVYVSRVAYWNDELLDGDLKNLTDGL